MGEQSIAYNCDGMESRKRQKDALKAIRARLDEEEQTGRPS